MSRTRTTKRVSGRLALQPGGHRAFEPAPLPPDPPLDYDDELRSLLSAADRALGRLDGIATTLPNPNLFVAMYVRSEAVMSSQIEGSQATLADVLQFEVDHTAKKPTVDVAEVVNYVDAMNHGLARLDELPLSLRLIREIHERLMQGVRGGERTPGEFRKFQNWIGAPGTKLEDASYVPPAPNFMIDALRDLEKFLHDDTLPPLVHAALVHAQFETIHPFGDGNGRVGRLLIALLLCKREVLGKPLLYLSHFLKRHRTEYYARLQDVHNGRWEEWLAFFLRGVAEMADSSSATAKKILAMREEHRAILGASGAASAVQLRALDHLFQHPILTARGLEEALDVTFATANKVLTRMQSLNIVVEQTGQQRNRRFVYEQYLDLFEAPSGLDS